MLLSAVGSQIRIDLHNVKLEIRVARVKPIDFRRIAVADRAIMPIKNQHRSRFSARLKWMMGDPIKVIADQSRGPPQRSKAQAGGKPKKSGNQHRSVHFTD